VPTRARSSVPSPSPSSQIPERIHKDAFWCSSITFYRPDPAPFPLPSTTQTRCQHRKHENATPVLCSSCLGCPCPLPTIFYHPDVADTPNMKMRPQCHVLRVWGDITMYSIPGTMYQCHTSICWYRAFPEGTEHSRTSAQWYKQFRTVSKGLKWFRTVPEYIPKVGSIFLGSLASARYMAKIRNC